MTLLLTGATGYLGGRVLRALLERDVPVSVLIRAKSDTDAVARLWQGMQLDFCSREFQAALPKIAIFTGDITQPMFGLASERYDRLVRSTTDIIHTAAALNRRSTHRCYQTNVVGTLNVIDLARAADAHNGLRRVTSVSTVSVAGGMSNRVIHESEMVDWSRPDLDPYGRTKKLAERLLREMLPAGRSIIVRPSAIVGDSTLSETTQFEIVSALAFMASAPVLPVAPTSRLDMVPVDFVTRCIVGLHFAPELAWHTYNVSAGVRSPTVEEIVRALRPAWLGRPLYLPNARRPFERASGILMNAPWNRAVSRSAALINVFLPYLCANAVFDATRIQTALGISPSRCVDYLPRLAHFAVEHRFKYPYRPLPELVHSA